MSSYRPQITRVTPSTGSSVSLLKEGRQLIQGGRLDEALEKFQTAAEADPTDRKAHLFCAAVLVRLKRFQEAVAYCEEVHRIDPTNVQAYLRHARALIGLEDWAGAREQAMTVLRIDPQTAVAHFILGYLAFRSGDYPEAAERYGRALLYQPRLLRARIELVRVAMLTERVEEAYRHATTGVRIDPKNGMAQEALGRVCLARNDFANALEAFEQAFASGRERGADARIGCAEAAIGLGELDRAETHLREAGEGAKHRMRLQRVWGELEFARGNYPMAVEQFRSALLLAGEAGESIVTAATLPAETDAAGWKALAESFRAELAAMKRVEETEGLATPEVEVE